MVCADPPDGFARRTVRFIAEKAVKRELVPTIGRGTIRLVLLNHDMKPSREKAGSSILPGRIGKGGSEYERCGPANVFRAVSP